MHRFQWKPLNRCSSRLTKAPVYRPALETQLLAQAHQHGASLAKVAHQIAMLPIQQSSQILKSFTEQDQAKILEMAYDDLYLQFIGRKVEESIAQPQLRQLLALRSQIDLDKQRQEPKDQQRSRLKVITRVIFQ